jgi:hypothetical protein
VSDETAANEPPEGEGPQGPSSPASGDGGSVDAGVGVNSARKPRGRPFQPGNTIGARGKPKGAKNKTTQMAESMVGRFAEQIVGRCIQKAVRDGDMTAVKLLVDRIYPTPKDRKIHFALAKKETGSLDVEQSIAVIADGIADGSISPSEASELTKLIDASSRLIELNEMEARLKAMEERLNAIAKP